MSWYCESRALCSSSCDDSSLNVFLCFLHSHWVSSGTDKSKCLHTKDRSVTVTQTFGYFQKSSRKKVPCCLGNVSRLNWFAWTDFGRVQRLQYRSRRGYGHWIWDISFTDHLLRANCMLCLLRSQGRMLHECYSSFSAERAFFFFFFFSQRYTGVHQKLPPLPFINWKCVEELSWRTEKHSNMQTMFPLMGLLNAQLDIHSLKINLN